jgi:hypothetical protein
MFGIEEGTLARSEAFANYMKSFASGLAINSFRFTIPRDIIDHGSFSIKNIEKEVSKKTNKEIKTNNSLIFTGRIENRLMIRITIPLMIRRKSQEWSKNLQVINYSNNSIQKLSTLSLTFSFTLRS